MSDPPKQEDQNRVVGICGSLRNGSFTRMALDVALEGAREVGASTQLIDLNDHQLIFCDGKRDENQYPEGVIRLRKELRAARGIILATPE